MSHFFETRAVYKRQKRGKWRVIFKEGGDTTSRSLETENESVADVKIETLKQKWEEGEIDPFRQKKLRKVSMTDAFDEFVQSMHRKDLADSTIKTYKGVVRRLIEHTGDIPLIDVEAHSVESFCKRRDLKQATKHKRFRHVRRFFNFCVEEDLLSEPPTDAFNVRQPKKRLPKAVSEKQLESLVNAVKADYHQKLSKRGGMNDDREIIWRIPIFQFAFFSGLRRGELARLRWEHVDFDSDLLFIYEQKNNKQETIALLDPAKKALQDLRDGLETRLYNNPYVGFDSEENAPQGTEWWRSSYVFTAPGGNPYERNELEWGNNLSNKFSYYVKEKTDLPNHLSLHGLRHGFCTYLAKQGTSPYTIQRLARHSDLSTTMQYVDLAQNVARAQGNEAFKNFGKTKGEAKEE